jgi:Xaa-Pro aminopeptidase
VFPTKTYVERRKYLSEQIGSGLILFIGNDESPMNYADNAYRFRQDSTFLYYFGVDQPGLSAIIDIDAKKEIVFGDELTVEDIVWMGAQTTIAEKAALAGVNDAKPLAELDDYVKGFIAKGKPVYFIPQYRTDNSLKLEKYLGIKHSRINDYSSLKLTKVIAAQRTSKSAEEIAEIEKSSTVSYEMYAAAMQTIRPGIYEREVAGLIEGIALSKGNGLSFPTIFSVRGEILHNHSYDNLMEAGQMVVCDSGVESDLHYASDITRTMPVSGKFTDRQKEIYNIVVNTNQEGIKAVKPGIQFKQVHLSAAKNIASGLKELGLLKGNIDEIVAAGAHALFFPHGLGHMLGLDVHDLENFGEKNTGYDNTVERSEQFGLDALRFGKTLVTGQVMTIEPGIYFIPQLINKWEKEQKLTQFVNYEKVKTYIGFGGIRVEDNVLVTKSGSRLLGKPIPKTVEEIETAMAH